MAESSAMNSSRPTVDYTNGDNIVKKEEEVTIKLESLECLVCTSRTRDCFDIYSHNTSSSGVSVHQFIVKYTQNTAVFPESCSKFVCRSCYDLINILEQAEAEYVKLKETFEAIISKNPLFELVNPSVDQTEVKDEATRIEDDSEDEPLARTKKSRSIKTVKKKKRVTTSKHKKKNDEDSWVCDECQASGDTGGGLSLAVHKLTMHSLPVDTAIKTEDDSQSPYNNSLLKETMEVPFDNYDDDNDSTYNPDDFTEEIDKKKKIKVRNKKITEKKTPKVMHPCDQCNARYSSLVRLESHKQKHDGSKPPYICEVCGAHYKHKRACDIHIALHKGISDWKCEECNKLFPSKNALQRHNNIHTGKLNYQCDLCGKSFIHTSSFKMHKLTHSGVKPHSCDVCGLALMTRSHLKRHKRIHSGEKRHECNVCGKRFSERYNLAAHQKSHDAAAVPPEPRRRLFRCHFCTDRFERRYMLERHTAVVHGRALERPPPTPRNTMSKLLKQRAQRPARADLADSAEAKDERSPESRASSAPALPPSKLLAQLSTSSSIITAGAWNGAYAAEFGIRSDFPH